MPRKVLALKITPQTYSVYENYPGIEHLPLSQINDQFLVRDEQIEGGVGYFSKLDFDKFYRALRNPMYFTKFTEVIRLPPPLGEQPEIVPSPRVRE